MDLEISLTFDPHYSLFNFSLCHRGFSLLSHVYWALVIFLCGLLLYVSSFVYLHTSSSSSSVLSSRPHSLITASSFHPFHLSFLPSFILSALIFPHTPLSPPHPHFHSVRLSTTVTPESAGPLWALADASRVLISCSSSVKFKSSDVVCIIMFEINWLIHSKRIDHVIYVFDRESLLKPEHNTVYDGAEGCHISWTLQPRKIK